MTALNWALRLVIPFAILYTIGYYVAGFSALTIGWLIILSVLIVGGEWLVETIVGKNTGRLGHGLITFLVATVVVFTVTIGIEGGQVPFGGAILAAMIIAMLESLLLPVKHEKVFIKERGEK